MACRNHLLLNHLPATVNLATSNPVLSEVGQKRLLFENKLTELRSHDYRLVFQLLYELTAMKENEVGLTKREALLRILANLEHNQAMSNLDTYHWHFLARLVALLAGKENATVLLEAALTENKLSDQKKISLVSWFRLASISELADFWLVHQKELIKDHLLGYSLMTQLSEKNLSS